MTSQTHMPLPSDLLQLALCQKDRVYRFARHILHHKAIQLVFLWYATGEVFYVDIVAVITDNRVQCVSQGSWDERQSVSQRWVRYLHPS